MRAPLSRFTPHLSRFRNDERGALALMFALMLPVMIGFIALGVDVGIWFKDRRELQTMADAAAVSAAIELANNATAAQILAAAQLEATANGFDATTDTIDYASTPTTSTNPAVNGHAGYIEVRITRKLETILSQVFITLSPTTTARAVAGTTGDKEACVLALSPTASPAINLSGGANVSMNGCGVVSNSTVESYSASACNNCNLTVDCLWAAGGVNEGTSSITSTQCDAPVEYAAPADDPFSSILTMPSSATIAAMPCAAGTAMSGGQTTFSGTVTLSEGRYCKGMKITGGAITLNPGTYIMDSGDFNMTGGDLYGDGVTILLTSSTSPASNTGAITLTGNGIVDLTAPTANDTTGTVTGDYIGILVYQDENASPPPNSTNKFTGGSTANFSGAIYTPKYDIDFTGGNATSGPDCLMLVGQAISFSGDAQMSNQCSMFGGNPLLYGAKPGLIE